jgi:septum formation protein
MTFRQGLSPEVVPSTFAEDLPFSSFDDIHEYPVSTATQKAVEVYQRLLVRPLLSIPFIFPQLAQDRCARRPTRSRHRWYAPSENLPSKQTDIPSADTVVFTHALPSTTIEMEEGVQQELLEKPSSKEDNMRMLMDLNGGVCEVVTGVSLGM